MQGSNGASSPRARFCFVHASDLRLDATMRGVADAPEPLRAAMRDAPLEAWSALVSLAVARRAAFVVVAGGVFGADVPSLRARVALRDGLERLRAEGIPAFIGLGAGDASALPLPEWMTAGATVFAEGATSAVTVRRDGVELATVMGTSCVRSDPPRLTDWPAPTAAPAIAVLPVARAAGASEPQVAAAGPGRIDYVAFGGGGEQRVDQGPPWVASPGPTQGRGLEPCERGAKGCLLVDVDDGRIQAATLVALDRVRALSIEVDAGGDEDDRAICRRVLDAFEPAAAEAPERALVVEAQLAGAVNAAREAGLLAELRQATADRTPPVWWTRVRLRSPSGAERGAAGQDLLRRALIAQSEALGAPLPRSAFLARHFAPLLRLWDGEIDLGEQRELVRDAGRVALAELDREQRS